MYIRRALLFLVAAVAAVLLGIFMVEGLEQWRGLFLVLLVIGIIALLVYPKIARSDEHRFLSKILIWGLVAKLVFALGRLWMDFYVYGGTADASYYNRVGSVIAQSIWTGNFNIIADYLEWGTKFVCLFTGLLYTLLGSSILGGYLAYGFLAFLGSYLFYRAFSIFYPEGDRRLYTVIIFLFPAILFWPNGIGKDSLIFLSMGIFAYGSARIVKGQFAGILPLIIGFFGTLLIRPHIAVLLGLAFALALAFHSRRNRPFNPLTLVFGVLIIVVMSWLVLPKVSAFVGIDQFSPQDVFDRLQMQQEATTYGGSSIQSNSSISFLTYPTAFITILFRPFPWEANSIPGFIQSLQGVFVFCLLLWRFKSITRAISSSLSNTYNRFIVFYAIGFIIIYASIGNFGIIARQNSMMLSFLFMLFAFSPLRKSIEVKPSQGSLVPVHDDLKLKPNQPA